MKELKHSLFSSSLEVDNIIHMSGEGIHISKHLEWTEFLTVGELACLCSMSSPTPTDSGEDNIFSTEATF